MLSTILLGDLSDSKISHLITFGRHFRDRKQYQKTLRNLLSARGWRALSTRLAVSGSSDSRPIFSREPKVYVNKEGDKHNECDYYHELILPEIEENVYGVKLYPYYYGNPKWPVSLGEAIIETAWRSKKALSPRVIVDGKNESKTRADTTIELKYIDPLFYGYLKRPVSVLSLDRTILEENLKIDTNEESQHRGIRLDDLMNQLKDSSFENIEFEVDPRVAATMVRIQTETNILTDILDAITRSSGVIWEWVYHNTILLIPGKNFPAPLTLPPPWNSNLKRANTKKSPGRGIARGPIDIDTVIKNGGRGVSIKEIIRDISTMTIGEGEEKKPLLNIRIEVHPNVASTLIRMKLKTHYLNEVLNALSHCSGVVWKWVDRKKILLFPGEDFGTFSKTYGLGEKDEPSSN